VTGSMVFQRRGPGSHKIGTGEKTQADTTALPATGFVPYPVRVDTSGQPLLGIDGKPVAAWAGTLADVLAAGQARHVELALLEGLDARNGSRRVGVHGARRVWRPVHH
jgi:hypothetical protein